MENMARWRQYGLTMAPFSSSVRRELYCSLPKWQELLYDLFKLINYPSFSCDEPLVMAGVLGPSGSGKSVLLSQFLDRVGSDIVVCSIRGDPAINALGLASTIAARFRVHGLVNQLHKLDRVSQLDCVIEVLSKLSSRYLLVIDDAHRLTKEVLHTLFEWTRLQFESRVIPLPILLVGDLVLKDRLFFAKGYQQDGSGICIHELFPFSQEDTRQYLTCRLKSAGWLGALPFDEATFARIYRLSGGLPGRVNCLAEQALLKYLKEAPNSILSDSSSSASASEFLRKHPLRAGRLADEMQINPADLIRPKAQTMLGWRKWVMVSQYWGAIVGTAFILLVGLLFWFMQQHFQRIRDEVPSYHYVLGYPSAIIMQDRDRHSFFKVMLEPLPGLKGLEVKQHLLSTDRFIADGQMLQSVMQGYVVQLLVDPNWQGLIVFLKMQHLFAAYQKAQDQSVLGQDGRIERGSEQPAPRIFRELLHNHNKVYALVYGPFKTRQMAFNWLKDHANQDWRHLKPWVRSIASVQQAMHYFDRHSL